MATSLEVVVTQNRTAHDGNVGVAADEVAWEQVDEVEQAFEGSTVDVHGPMFPAHRDAMLVVVRVRAVPHAPRLAADGNLARVAALEVGVAHAQRTGPRPARRRIDVGIVGLFLRRCRNGARILLGFRQIDRDLQLAPLRVGRPRDVARNIGNLHVICLAARVVELIGVEIAFRHAYLSFFPRVTLLQRRPGLCCKNESLGLSL